MPSFTPELKAGNTTLIVDKTTADFVKLDSLVFIRINLLDIEKDGTGELYISGLPFLPNEVTVLTIVPERFTIGTGRDSFANTLENEDRINIRYTRDDGGAAKGITSEMLSNNNNSDIWLSGVYTTDQ